MNNNISIMRQFIFLTSTIFTSRFISALASLISFIFISRLSLNASAAGSLIAIIQVPLFTCATSFLYSFSLLFSKAYGEKNTDHLIEIAKMALVFSLLITVVMVLIVLNLKSILLILHQPINLIPYIRSYFNILAAGILPAMLIICLSQYFSSINCSQIILKRTVFLFPISIILNYGLIFGKIGFPKLGISGAAYAIVISYWILFFWLLKDFFMDRIDKSFLNKIIFNFNIALFKKIFKVGLSIMLQNSTDYLFLFVLTLMIGRFGSLALAAQQVINQLNIFLFLIPFAIAQSASILVSQSIGRKDAATLSSTSNLAIRSVLFLTVMLSAVLLIFRHKIIALYLGMNLGMESQLNQMTLNIFYLFILFQFFNAIKTVMTGLLRGLHMTRIPMLVSLFSNWVIGWPVACILGFFFNLGAFGVNIGYLTSALISFSLLAWYWIKVKMKVRSL